MNRKTEVTAFMLVLISILCVAAYSNEETSPIELITNPNVYVPLLIIWLSLIGIVTIKKRNKP